MNAKTQTDEELLARMTGGSEQAFTALYRRHQGRVYRFAWQMSGSQQLAEEATQETFLALLNRSGGFEEGRGSVAAYLMGIARNQVLRLLRRDGIYVPLAAGGDGEDDPAPEPSVAPCALEDLTRKEMLEYLRQVILSLPPAYREAVVLCDLQEMDYADAAGALGCAAGTLKSRLHRGRAMLAERLKAKRGLEPERCWA